MRSHYAIAFVCLIVAINLTILIDSVLGSSVAFRGTIESRRMGLTDGWDTFTVSVRPSDWYGPARVETIDVPVRYDDYWAAKVCREVTVCFRRGLITGHCYNIHVVLGHRT